MEAKYISLRHSVELGSRFCDWQICDRQRSRRDLQRKLWSVRNWASMFCFVFFEENLC
jgi:hypothetical protein